MPENGGIANLAHYGGSRDWYGSLPTDFEVVKGTKRGEKVYAFLVTTDVLEIYMQEFWATSTIHHHSIRFKMDNKKHIVNLESFRDMLHICPRLPGQSFVEPPFEEEILAFLRFLGHSGAIRRLTDVNIIKLHQPWRSFAAIIKKCLIGKSSGYDSLRLSQAQLLWGLYHKRNVDFAYLMWEDFVYQVEHKDTKKSNEMYYPRFTKVIIHHFMSKDPSILRRNKFGALLPIELTNKDIGNSNAYKEYYAVATGATPPQPKASVRKTRSSSDTKITPPTTVVAMIEAQQLKLATKRSLQQIHISQPRGSGADDRTSTLPGVPDGPTAEPEEDISCKSIDDEGDDDEQAFDEEEFIHPSLSTHVEEEPRDEESFDPILKTPKNNDDEGNGKENLCTKEGHDEEEEEDELYIDININLGRVMQTTQEFEDSQVTLTPVNPDGQQQNSSVSSQFVTSRLNSTLDARMESIFETTLQMDVQTPTSVDPLPMSAPTITPSTIATITTTLQAPTPPTTTPSTRLQDLPDFATSHKALVEAYESDKIILDTYGDIVTLKRRRDDDADRDEEPFAGSDRGSKRRREGKDPESASAPMEKATRSAGNQHKGLNLDRHRQANRDWNKTLPTTHESIQPWISELVKQYDSCSSFNELMDTPVDFSNFLMNQLKVYTLTLELLAGPTYELMKGSCKSLVELELLLEEVYKAITNQLDWVNPEGQQYLHNLLKPLPLIPNNQGELGI
nr:hypothetical protein [Tanacetum cinerariifolium]